MKCCAALLTPAGRGAIATVVVSGPDAARVVAHHLVRPRRRQPAESSDTGATRAAASRPSASLPSAPSLHYALWDKDLREEIVLHRSADDLFEIHCHGGRAAAAAVLASLERFGCELLDWRQHLARTETSLLRAEALEALAEATTERAAGILLDQLDGALEHAVTAILERLSTTSPKDVADEGDAPPIAGTPCNRAAIVAALDELLRRAKLGLHLTAPWKVVLCGPPNVGKSTLLNALLGYERAITSEFPGTTRDVVTAQAALEGWPVELIDGAGLRRSDDELEQAGMGRTEAVLREADLCVLVFDRSKPLEESGGTPWQQWPGALCVANKCDLPSANDPALPPDALSVSALHGEGVLALAQVLADRLVPNVPRAGCAVPFTERQVGHLRAARVSAESGNWSAVTDALQALLDR